jgi:ribosomal-protein-alanine acetyltransferase
MSIAPVLIVPARISDLDAILAVEAKCKTVTWSPAAFSSELSGSNKINLAALDANATMCGFIFSASAADELEINTLAVDPDHRRNGIATLLMNAAAAEGFHRGAASLHLEVRSKNTPAIRLYTKLGFEIRWVRKSYYSDDGDDALMMSRELPLVVPNVP